jgi:hypothetical protein
VSQDRYARQRAVPGIGAVGQDRLAKAEVRLDGEGLEAELAALYLAGAGVGELIVPAHLVELCRAHNSTIHVDAGGVPGPLAVTVGGRRHDAVGWGAIDRGARAARWAIAAVLSA